MTPLERAARVLCSLDGNPENATMKGKPFWQNYLPEARAAIGAIVEPSQEMVDAAEDEIFRNIDATETDGKPDADDVWRKMIAVILNRL